MKIPLISKANKLVLLILFVLVPFSASANMIWPALYVISQYYTWYVILIGLIVEFFAIKHYLKVSWGRAALIAVTMNLISAITGLILIPLCGYIMWFPVMILGGTNFVVILYFIFCYIAAVLCNVAVEGLVLKLLFKYPFKENFWWLTGANAVSVMFCAYMLFFI